jgi:diaminohydroxyphosphoribosylaminopyrimidine deaminase/5-amino-6-(5-phosphoribosylamino)uracil reductase
MTALERSAVGSRPDLRSHDERFMRLALAIGARNLGLSWPNPSVGAVVVDERGPQPVIVAQGVTQPGGRPHAERVALEMAGERARGATLYVSLEPCSHQGKTPPCIDAVREFGVARVVTAIEDPDTRVSGRGHALLRQAGVAVLSGVLFGEATRAHRGHILRVTQGRPSVMLKIARTADGFAARRGGGRLMISGPRSNARTHLIRARHDAIMVGIGTVLTDDPLLTVRLPGLEARSPVRVVIDSALRTPPEAQIVRTANGVPTWIVAAESAPLEAERRLVAAGVEVMRVGARDGRVDIEAALRLLADRGITRVFSEGGPNLAEALIAADCVDEFATATSRTALGEEGFPALGPLLSRALSERFMRMVSEDLGTDVLDIYERTR